MECVFVAAVEDAGEKQGERVLGVFKHAGDAHRAVCEFNPWDDAALKIDWRVVKGFNKTHESGAVHVTLYALEGSAWWKGSVIAYKLK